MSGPFGSSQWMYATGAVEGQSLRFNDDDSAYLSWTPASAGNRKTWTWSAWVKRGSLSAANSETMFGADSTSPQTNIRFRSSHQLQVAYWNGSSYTFDVRTSALFRDVSAWYHIVVSVDTTQATASDRVKIYVNGTRVTAFDTASYPSLNLNTEINNTRPHGIGAFAGGASKEYFDGYMSEVNVIDGTALGPTSFGETDANGQWVPIKEPSVTYGTNGFYLPFTNDYEVEGFNTITYIGDGGTQYVGGVGFEPDLVWIKRREGSESHILQDSVRGAARQLFTNTTEAELSGANNVQSFETDGFVVGTDSGSNGSGRSFVAWAWDAGTGSAASNTDGSITSLVKANPDYGFSIVSYTGTGANATVGHGLSSAPEIAIFKNRDTSSDWRVYYHVDGLGSGVRYVALNSTAASVYDPNIWQNTTASNTVLKIGSASQVNGSSNDLIAYCFHSVAGYSDFGNYTGNGSSTGPTVTTGFKPAFLILKRTDGVNSWTIQDNTRDPSNPIDLYLLADDSGAEGTSGLSVDFLSNGFQIKTTSSAVNASGGTYIYMAFADKREAAFWLDQSGNNNDWTNNNMQESDISLDSPTNNFATLNNVVPNYIGTVTYSQGNLRAYASSNSGYAESTISITSGKYYTEMLYESGGGTLSGEGLGFTSTGGGSNSVASGYAYRTNGTIYIDGTNSASVSTYTTGDVVAMAIDADNGEVRFYKNGTLIYTGTGLSYPRYTPFVWNRASSAAASVVINFGQDSSFAGNKVAQGNQDENGFGDFYYAPPAGYLALCTQNLPNPAITDGSEHFNTVLYTGNGSTNAITGVGFQPDFVWTKPRSFSDFHQAFDSVRGTGKNLSINQAVAEQTQSGSLSSFDSDGFTIGSWSNLNSSGSSFVAWNWKADNTSGSSNTDGTITSTVSANTTAGFSIVGYTGDGNSSATIGHGLNAAPEMMLFKGRTFTSNWTVYHVGMGNDGGMQLNQTAAEAVNSQYWNNTTPTSSVFTIGLYENTSSEDFICYAFHSVEGYSKFGSYTGNGSSDGPFVYTGFRPAWVMVKNASTTGNWQIMDNKRNTYNVVNNLLNPNSSVAEAVSGGNIADFTSNGFKVRGTGSVVNGSGNNIIYMAFAESPFKYSNAR